MLEANTRIRAKHKGAPGQASLWALPDRHHDTFTSPCINRWFQASCDILGLRPPQGEKWVGHSHRSGGATAALSIDASLPVIARFGVWDHIGSPKHTWMPPSGRLLTPSSSSSTSSSQVSMLSASSSQCSAHKLRGSVFCSVLLVEWF